MTPLELKHFRLLIQCRNDAQALAFEEGEQLEDFVLELRDSGASVRGIARKLGVSSSSIQTWTNNARARRAQHPPRDVA